MNEAPQIPVALDKYIATRERRFAAAFGYESNLRDEFVRLLCGGTVRYGGRASCGHKTNGSWQAYVAWKEIITKASSLGIKVKVDPIQIGNGWATKAGGFWEENDYRLISE